MRRILLVTLALIALTAPAIAQLNKYKNWAESPEAYFLTAAEREEWSRLKTDEEAEAFVGRYYAKRGSDFMEQLTERIQMTDKYLTVGKKPGSETTRGRLTILFGPPLKLERVTKSRSADRSNAITPIVDGGGSERNSGVSLSDATQAATSVSAVKGGSSSVIIDTMTWSGERLPKPLTDAVVVRIEVDSAGREKIQGTSDERDKLDRLIETVVQSTIRSAS